METKVNEINKKENKTENKEQTSTEQQNKAKQEYVIALANLKYMMFWLDKVKKFKESYPNYDKEQKEVAEYYSALEALKLIRGLLPDEMIVKQKKYQTIIEEFEKSHPNHDDELKKLWAVPNDFIGHHFMVEGPMYCRPKGTDKAVIEKDKAEQEYLIAESKLYQMPNLFYTVIEFEKSHPNYRKNRKEEMYYLIASTYLEWIQQQNYEAFPIVRQVSQTVVKEFEKSHPNYRAGNKEEMYYLLALSYLYHSQENHSCNEEPVVKNIFKKTVKEFEKSHPCFCIKEDALLC